jgi:hypothetical protein
LGSLLASIPGRLLRGVSGLVSGVKNKLVVENNKIKN